MATAQKRAFRFPWESEPNRDESDAASLAERLDAVQDDLGRGPFDLPPASDSEVAEMPAPEPEAVAVAVAPPTSTKTSQDEAVTATPPVEPAVDESPDAWPDADRRGTRATPPSAPASSTEAATAVFPPKRANPLVAGLVRAMREAAKVARDEAVTSLRADAVARGEAIRVEGTTTAAELRKAADADTAEIREWSKAEMARVREETETRIVARKARLSADTETAAEAVEQLLGQLAATVEAFEAETATFFDHLLAEEDPARLAGLAERMPQPPSLDDATVVAAAAPPPQRRRLEAPKAAAPEPTAEPGAAAEAELEPVAVTEPEALGADDAAAAEAAALAGLDGQTQLVVSGLVGVAAIATFKGALMRSPGVNAVSVNAGSDGDVLFTVTHGEDADLPASLHGMDGFQARIIADDGTRLVVVVQDPAE